MNLGVSAPRPNVEPLLSRGVQAMPKAVFFAVDLKASHHTAIRNVTAGHRRSEEFVLGSLLRFKGYTCVLEVGDTVKDKSDSIKFLVRYQSWILGQCPPGYTHAVSSLRLKVNVT